MEDKREEKTSLVASEGKGGIDENQGNIEFATTQKGVNAQTIDNMILALTLDDELAKTLAHNQFTDRIVIQKNVPWNRDGRTDNFDDIDLSNICWILEKQYGLSSEKKILTAIQIVADANRFHPIHDILESLEWDGRDRIAELFPKYLGAERCDYTTEITKNWLMGAINRVYHPGCKYDTMLVLIDVDGGGGKSSLARFLAINDDYFTDDVKDFDDGRIVEKLAGHWIIEMGEMQAVANAKSIESLKAFLSRQKDIYRVPYGRFSKDYPRQCVFIGTSNDTQFLPQDSSGYRRFMPLRVDKTKAEIHPLADVNETREFVAQLWAQAMAIYNKGDYSLELDDSIRNQLESVVNEYAPEDIKFLSVKNWLDSNRDIKKVCTSMIYEKALKNDDYKKARQWELKEITQIMNRMPGWVLHPTKSHQVRFDIYGPMRAWDRVPKDKLPKPILEDSDDEEIPF